MRIESGRVVNGQIVLEGEAHLEEGEQVMVMMHEGGLELEAEEEADLAAAIEEADAEEGVDADEFFATLGTH